MSQRYEDEVQARIRSLTAEVKQANEAAARDETIEEMVWRLECTAAGELGDTSDRDRLALRFILDARAELLAACKAALPWVAAAWRANPGLETVEAGVAEQLLRAAIAKATS